MALIEVFHVVATDLSVDASGPDIPQGLIVTLDENGQVVAADSSDETQPGGGFPIGIAADSLSAGTTSFTPESNSGLSRNPSGTLTGALVVGALGAQQRFTQNRVADNFNEVLSSGKMTVYHSGGEFWTDQYEVVHSDGLTISSFNPAQKVYASQAGETAAVSDVVERSGRFTDQAQGDIVGMVLTDVTSYPSGVPGTETGFNSLPEGGNSLTWGNFLHVKLVI